MQAWTSGPLSGAEWQDAEGRLCVLPVCKWGMADEKGPGGVSGEADGCGKEHVKPGRLFLSGGLTPPKAAGQK